MYMQPVHYAGSAFFTQNNAMQYVHRSIMLQVDTNAITTAQASFPHFKAHPNSIMIDLEVP